MAKFKVGDRVRAVGETAIIVRGRVFTVAEATFAAPLHHVFIHTGTSHGVLNYTDDMFEPVAVAPATATLEHKFKVGDLVNNDHNDYTVAKLITKYGKSAVEYTSGDWDFESGIKLVHRYEPTPDIHLDLEFIPVPQVGDAVLIPGWIAGITNSARGTNYNIVFETQNRRVSLHFLEEDFILDEDGDDEGDCPCANNDNGPVPTGDTAKAFDALGDWLRTVAINPSAAFRSNKEAA